MVDRTGLSPVTLHLIVLNTLILVISSVLSSLYDISLSSYLGAHSAISHNFALYQFVTYMFLHADFIHLFFNMFILWMFGSVLERVWGPSLFTVFYLTCGMGAGILHSAVLTWEHWQLVRAVEEAFVQNSLPAIERIGRLTGLSHSSVEALVSTLEGAEFLLYQFIDRLPMVGASGAIFGILTAFGLLFPDVRLYLFFMVPVRAIYAVLIFGAIELVLAIINAPGDFIAHYAHLGGMLIAFLLVKGFRRLRPPFL